ncbi:MAG: heme biosynthesis protein HemY [Beijerinckiaceae bacterium]|nr:heme biosynthesis protein HemY [Beijerinckiaceae bacterium]
MFRILVFLISLLPVALLLNFLADQPGSVTVTVAGKAYETSLVVGVVAIALVGFALMVAWSFVSFGFRLPGLISLSNRVRRRSKGISAISRGMVAVGSGDARLARQQASEAERLLGREPLTLLLKAQAAQLSGERADAEAAFSSMLDAPETRVLGLRGLFVEARRRNDMAAARAHAEEAHALAPTVPWASRSVLEYASMDRDWQRAIAAVERMGARNVVARGEARRLKAVLLTAQAQDLGDKAPDEALKTALAALKLEPGLVPAAVLAGRRLSERGDYAKASKVLETAWKQMPHPDLADAYLDVRRGDSALDRLKRAKVLSKLMPGTREARFAAARAALDAREFALARENLEALVLDKVTARAALMLAELEDMEHGRSGPAREWLERASRAPRDPSWVADGCVSETWAPVSPVSGRIDAFEWREPPQAIEASLRAEIDAERLAHDHSAPVRPAELEHAGAMQAGDQTAHAVTVVDRPDAASADEARPADLPEKANGGAQPSAARPQSRGAKPTPIIFPVAHAPDDPGS